MKKIFLTIILVVGISQIAKAQLSVGGGIALWGDIGIEAKADYLITEKISISPSIDYFFLNQDDFGGVSVTQLMFNVDGHYNFNVSDGFTAYPLVGVNYHYFSLSTDYDDEYDYSNHGGDFGINIGGGATYALSDSMKLYAEAKYLRDDFGLSLGVLFSL